MHSLGLSKKRLVRICPLLTMGSLPYYKVKTFEDVYSANDKEALFGGVMNVVISRYPVFCIFNFYLISLWFSKLCQLSVYPPFRILERGGHISVSIDQTAEMT